MECPTPAQDETPPPIYTVEHFELVWCWPDLPSLPHYRVETRTNGGAWVEEAVVDTNHVRLRRDLGDAVELRVRACWESSCGDYSGTSAKVWVLPNFDLDSNGFVDQADLARLRASNRLGGLQLAQFMRVYLRAIVGRRYE